jgi:hypothetical protein
MEKVQNVHFQKIVHILKKCSDYKNVQFFLKKSDFKICSYLKIAQVKCSKCGKCSFQKVIHILNMFRL